MIYLRLFFEFFQTGLFSVGGGLATIPFLTDMGARTGWFTSGELADMIAISESTPGAMGVNMATYVGFHVGGIPGGVIATLGLICPSILVILIIARFLQRFRQSRGVDAVFYGFTACVRPLPPSSPRPCWRCAPSRWWTSPPCLGARWGAPSTGRPSCWPW